MPPIRDIYQYGNVTSMTDSRGQSVSYAYNAMQLPDTIGEGGYRATFKYRGDGTRSQMFLGHNDGSMQVRYYDGQFNRYHRNISGFETTKDILWLAGTPYTAPAALVRVSDGPVPGGDNWRLYYVVRDNQGSIVAVTDSAGGVLQALRYDPWGNILDNADGHLLTRGEQPELLLERGYTGHEHLQQFGLINMNARLYEPLTARFLSPDPEVQAPDFSQNLNRYSYCLNNPLRYIDPTGMVAFSAADTVGMTGEQKDLYFDILKYIEENEILRDIYNKLDQDLDFLYGFSFGETPLLNGRRVEAAYQQSTKSIIYNDNNLCNGINYQQLIEELMHAYQDYLRVFDAYEIKEKGYNIELEAKLATAYIVSHHNTFHLVENRYSGYNYLFKLFNNMQLQSYPVISRSLYLKAAKQFVRFNLDTGMKDKHYLSPANQLSPFMYEIFRINR